ncbi:MAG: hypothetical protein GWN76_14650, partial [candidate division Zixibacteria bacterium]|nr:hypothetical protein [candidate division Zixibacteria bacterium]NIR65380.1 hypothetical protein [candidate division Zixibacteria bacterium]NIU15210.1 hypothetical protein [candidate division Zixibacteria bacterium]
MTVKAYTTYSALDDYSDMAFPEVTFSDHTGDTTAAYKFITAGPDGPPSSGDIPNVLPGRLRVGATGNFILLDPNDPIIKMDEGGVDRVLLGDVGSGVYGLQVNDENGDPVIKIVGTGGSAEHFFAQAITLGDGSNYSGSITLNHADGQGDTYVAGKDSAATFDFPNWEVDGGFILGVDDSESVDTTKFFVGDSGSNYLKYDGTEFVYHSGSSGALRILGGGDIFLEGDDAEGDKALVIFETDIQLGATVTTKALGLWDNAEGNDKYFVVGHEPTYVGSFTLERKPFMSVIVDTSYEFDVDVFHPNNGATSHAVLYLSTQSDDSQEYTQLGAYKGTDQASLIMRVYDTPQS